MSHRISAAAKTPYSVVNLAKPSKGKEKTAPAETQAQRSDSLARRVYEKGMLLGLLDSFGILDPSRWTETFPYLVQQAQGRVERFLKSPLSIQAKDDPRGPVISLSLMKLFECLRQACGKHGVGWKDIHLRGISSLGFLGRKEVEDGFAKLFAYLDIVSWQKEMALDINALFIQPFLFNFRILMQPLKQAGATLQIVYEQFCHFLSHELYRNPLVTLDQLGAGADLLEKFSADQAAERRLQACFLYVRNHLLKATRLTMDGGSLVSKIVLKCHDEQGHLFNISLKFGERFKYDFPFQDDDLYFPLGRILPTPLPASEPFALKAYTPGGFWQPFFDCVTKLLHPPHWKATGGVSFLTCYLVALGKGARLLHPDYEEILVKNALQEAGQLERWELNLSEGLASCVEEEMMGDEKALAFYLNFFVLLDSYLPHTEIQFETFFKKVRKHYQNGGILAKVAKFFDGSQGYGAAYLSFLCTLCLCRPASADSLYECVLQEMGTKQLLKRRDKKAPIVVVPLFCRESSKRLQVFIARVCESKDPEIISLIQGLFDQVLPKDAPIKEAPLLALDDPYIDALCDLLGEISWVDQAETWVQNLGYQVYLAHAILGGKGSVQKMLAGLPQWQDRPGILENMRQLLYCEWGMPHYEADDLLKGSFEKLEWVERLIAGKDARLMLVALQLWKELPPAPATERLGSLLIEKACRRGNILDGLLVLKRLMDLSNQNELLAAHLVTLSRFLSSKIPEEAQWIFEWKLLVLQLLDKPLEESGALLSLRKALVSLGVNEGISVIDARMQGEDRRKASKRLEELIASGQLSTAWKELLKHTGAIKAKPVSRKSTAGIETPSLNAADFSEFGTRILQQMQATLSTPEEAEQILALLENEPFRKAAQEDTFDEVRILLKLSSFLTKQKHNSQRARLEARFSQLLSTGFSLDVLSREELDSLSAFSSSSLFGPLALACVAKGLYQKAWGLLWPAVDRGVFCQEYPYLLELLHPHIQGTSEEALFSDTLLKCYKQWPAAMNSVAHPLLTACILQLFQMKKFEEARGLIKLSGVIKIHPAPGELYQECFTQIIFHQQWEHLEPVFHLFEKSGSSADHKALLGLLLAANAIEQTLQFLVLAEPFGIKKAFLESAPQNLLANLWTKWKEEKFVGKKKDALRLLRLIEMGFFSVESAYPFLEKLLLGSKLQAPVPEKIYATLLSLSASANEPCWQLIAVWKTTLLYQECKPDFYPINNIEALLKIIGMLENVFKGTNEERIWAIAVVLNAFVVMDKTSKRGWGEIQEIVRIFARIDETLRSTFSERHVRLGLYLLKPCYQSGNALAIEKMFPLAVYLLEEAYRNQLPPSLITETEGIVFQYLKKAPSFSTAVFTDTSYSKLPLLENLNHIFTDFSEKIMQFLPLIPVFEDLVHRLKEKEYYEAENILVLIFRKSLAINPKETLEKVLSIPHEQRKVLFTKVTRIFEEFLNFSEELTREERESYLLEAVLLLYNGLDHRFFTFEERRCIFNALTPFLQTQLDTIANTPKNQRIFYVTLCLDFCMLLFNLVEKKTNLPEDEGFRLIKHISHLLCFCLEIGEDEKNYLAYEQIFFEKGNGTDAMLYHYTILLKYLTFKEEKNAKLSPLLLGKILTQSEKFILLPKIKGPLFTTHAIAYCYYYILRRGEFPRNSGAFFQKYAVVEPSDDLQNYDIYDVDLLWITLCDIYQQWRASSSQGTIDPLRKLLLKTPFFETLAQEDKFFFKACLDVLANEPYKQLYARLCKRLMKGAPLHPFVARMIKVINAFSQITPPGAALASIFNMLEVFGPICFSKDKNSFSNILKMTISTLLEDDLPKDVVEEGFKRILAILKVARDILDSEIKMYNDEDKPGIESWLFVCREILAYLEARVKDNEDNAIHHAFIIIGIRHLVEGFKREESGPSGKEEVEDPVI